MTEERSVDERISAWLLDEAPSQLPDRVLRQAFGETRATRQVRTLLPWRSPMLRFTPATFAAGAAAIALLAVGIALSTRPSTSGPPIGSASPAPTGIPAASLGSGLVPVALTGEVAFVATVDGNTDIYLMNADRSNVRRLTDDPAEDQNPEWLPGGMKLMFDRRTQLDPELAEIYVVDVATGIETALTNTHERAAGARVSPDGTKIAYEHAAGVFVMNIDGSGQRRVFTADGFYTLLGWSNGASVVMRREASQELVRLDIASGKLTTLSEAEEPRNGVLSPDGELRAFSDATHRGIWVAAADGSAVRHVVGDWTRAYATMWMPDSRHLLFAQGDGWLYVVALDGSGLTRWTEALAAAPRPSP